MPMWIRESRYRSFLLSSFGLFFLSMSFIPVVASDTLARSVVSFACCAAGLAFLIADFLLFPEIQAFWPLIAGPRTRRNLILSGLFGSLLALFFVASSVTLTKFYSQRLKHARLLEKGHITRAKILRRCGWRTHGCLTIDVSENESRIQKSIPVDVHFYRKLAEGDSLTVVHPRGDIKAAVFTEFNFDRWKPQVPRAWGFIFFCLLSALYYPSKRWLRRVVDGF